MSRHFNESHAREDLLQYRQDGLRRITKMLIDGLPVESKTDASLLDIGAGVGIIAHELAADGLASATLVEISSAYVAVGEAEIKRCGLDDRITFLHGDFVELAPRIAPADVVTLDRVVCCYKDFERLVALSAQKARRWYAVSYPRDRWYVKIGVAVKNLRRRRRGNAFRTYVHSPRAMHRLVIAAGFEQVFQRGTAMWQTSIYRRTDGG